MIRHAALMSCLLLCAACEDRTPPTPVDQTVRPARVMTVQLGATARRVELVGRLEAAQSIDMAFEVSGPLRELPVLEGQEVTRGQRLASLDQSDFQLAVREAEVQLRLAQQDLDRKVRVLKEHGIARSAVDDAQSLRDLQRVRLQQARETLADATLEAPFDGLVAQRFVDNFVNVNAGQPILRLHANNELYVVANVPEHLAATVSQEEVEEMYATFAFSGEQRFELSFREVRGEADRVAQSIEASFAMSRSPDWNFMPGMTATVHITLRESGSTVVFVPASAIVADAEQQLFVWVLDTSSLLVSRRYVQVSSTTRAGMEVIDGLADGDVIVTTGAATLRDGLRVRPFRDRDAES